jgi:isopenicillin-N N-acyltransferase-like protein
VVLRGILNSSSLEESRSAILRPQRSASANYLVACADGRAFNAETAPGGSASVFFSDPEDDLLAHSNHYTCGVSFADLGAEAWPDSACRIDRMSSALTARHGELSPSTLVEVLRDHDGFPHSLCRHVDPGAPPVEQAMTVASWIVDLDDRLAVIAAGPPCQADFEPLTPGFARDRSVSLHV